MHLAKIYLLELVAKARIPIDCLFSTKARFEQFLNMKWHGLSRHTLTSVLSSLASNRLICCGEPGNSDGVSGEELESKLPHIGECNLYYGLTQAGGKKWEEYAKPDWSRFYTAFYSKSQHAPTLHNLDIRSHTKDSVKRILQFMEFQDDIEVLSAEMPIVDLKPWNATYWRSFDSGCRLVAKFRFKDHTESKQRLLEFYGAEEGTNMLAKFRREEDYFLNWYESLQNSI